MTNSVPHIVFAGGVTGGHLFPGLAVAEQLIATMPTARITFAGPGGRLEREHVARAGYEYVTLTCPRAPRGITETARFGYRMLRGYRGALGYLRRSGASVVVGLGGFASAPASLAAAWLGVPLLLLEQNSIVGRTNRRLARVARGMCLSFAAAQGRRDVTPTHPCPTLLTGTPVRSQFLRTARHSASSPVLLVVGGSGGAQLLNESVPPAVAQLTEALAGWQIVHQAGTGNDETTAAAYRAAGIAATVAPFFDDLPAIMDRAQLAVCRAGGSTLAELAVMRLPAILVPLAGAMDDHQRQNAIAFAAAGAAAMVDSLERPVRLAERLRYELAGLVASPQRRAAMQTSLGRFAYPLAAQQISEIVLQWAQGDDSIDQDSLPFPLASPACIDSLAA